MTHKPPQGIDAGFKLSDDQRLSLYTLMHQWSRNTDLQFNQVISWVEEATQLALDAAPPDPRKDLAAPVLAQSFHEAYERLAPQFGYETRKESAVAWADVPERNRKLMIAVCAELLAEMRGAKR